MKYLKFILILLILNSCSKKYTTVYEYESFPVKFLKTTISYPTNDFSIAIPKSWIWKVEKYNTKQIILGIDATSFDSITRFSKVISVHKYKSTENNTELEKEYQSSIKLFEKNGYNLDVVENGKTKINNYDAYFLHTKSDNDQSIETITYIIKSKEKGIFYSLTASCQIQDELKINMSMMIKCLQTFEYN